MLSNKRRAIRAFIFVIASISLIGGAMYWHNGWPDRQLLRVRKAAEAVLLADKIKVRINAAEQCMQFSELIMKRQDRIGYTASLLTIGVAPIVGNDGTSIAQLPNEKQVEELSTEDLILVSRLLFHTGRFGPSDQLIDLILSRTEGHQIEALRLASMVRFELGRDDDVVRHCVELLRLSPNDANAWRVKAMAHRNHGAWDHFTDAAEKSIQYGTAVDPVLQIELIDGYVHLARTAEARTLLDKVRQSRPDLVERAPLMHARLLIQEGNITEAYEIVTSYLEESDDDEEALILKGQLLIAKGNFEEALTPLLAAIQLAPAEELAYYQLGQAYARMGDSEKAKQNLNMHRSILDRKVRLHSMELLASREPSNISVRSELARMYQELGLTELSEFWIRAARAAEGK